VNCVDLSWITDILSNWQADLIALLVGAALSWIAKHLFVDKPKIVSMIVSILETLEGTIKQLLGDKWAPAYDALLKAGQAAVDGNVSADEAYDVAVTAFDAAIKVAGVELTEDERNNMIGILKFIVTSLLQNKSASKTAMRSVRTSLKKRGVI
jgi:hypothetical protein